MRPEREHLSFLRKKVPLKEIDFVERVLELKQAVTQEVLCTLKISYLILQEVTTEPLARDDCYKPAVNSIVADWLTTANLSYQIP
jgi:hypothetical protein